MSGFTDWFSIHKVVGDIIDYVASWYAWEIKKEIVDNDIDSGDEWGQFVIIDEEHI
jgi:hypothetical protein